MYLPIIMNKLPTNFSYIENILSINILSINTKKLKFELINLAILIIYYYTQLI